MDAMTAFGLFAVTAMVLCYALEQRSRWYAPGFAVACGRGSIFGFMQGVWPLGLVEAVRMIVAIRKWGRARHACAQLESSRKPDL